MQKWLDNPRHQGVKRDIGEVLTPSKYANECDLEDESDEPTASDIDFIDDSELVNGEGQANGMHSPAQSLPSGVTTDPDEISDDKLRLVPNNVGVDDTEESEMGYSENGYFSDVEDNSDADKGSDEECQQERPKKPPRKRGKKLVSDSEYVLSSCLCAMSIVPPPQ